MKDSEDFHGDGAGFDRSHDDFLNLSRDAWEGEVLVFKNREKVNSGICNGKHKKYT